MSHRTKHDYIFILIYWQKGNQIEMEIEKLLDVIKVKSQLRNMDEKLPEEKE